MATPLAIPCERLFHGTLWKTIPGKFIRWERAFSQPMSSPTIAGIGICGILKTVAAQRVKHLVLDGFNRRRKIRNEMVRIGVQADDNGIGEKSGDLFIRAVCLEKLVVD